MVLFEKSCKETDRKTDKNRFMEEWMQCPTYSDRDGQMKRHTSQLIDE